MKCMPLLLVALAACVSFASCASRYEGTGVAGGDSTRPDATDVKDAATTEPEATSRTGEEGGADDKTDDAALVCVDAPNGRTDTDACAGNRQPCQTACDCCFYVEGASCPAGYCVQAHAQ